MTIVFGLCVVDTVEKDVITEEEKEETYRSKEHDDMMHNLIPGLG